MWIIWCNFYWKLEADYKTDNETTNDKIIKGPEKGKYTKTQIFEYPRYVKSTLKKEKILGKNIMINTLL